MMDLPPDVKLADVKWRVDGKPSQQEGRNPTARFVPYVDASTVAALLDEWTGPTGWRDTYERDGKGLWCHLSVRDVLTGEWVTKNDIGVESNFEAEKGQVSDAFKRCATIKWGVARNVYRLPTLWAPCRVDGKGNAWPNDDTTPAILKQLKAKGFDDAAVGEATAEHADDEPTAPPTGGDAEHKALRLAVQNLTPKKQTAFKKWRVDHGLPAFASALSLTVEQIKEALDHVNQLAEEENREVEGQEDGASTEVGIDPEGDGGGPPSPDEAPASRPALGGVRARQKAERDTAELLREAGMVDE